MFRKFILGAVGALSIAGAAAAADMPVKAAPVFNWTGFYVGVHGGYADGDATLTGIGVFGIDGGFGGAQIGYNWQFNRNWVFGIEADISGGDINGAVSAVVTTGVDVMGTVRARLGAAFNNVLVYGTGGIAWARGDVSAGGVSVNNTHFGYAVGAGIEWAFSRNWSAKIEYLYVDLDQETYVATPVGFDFSSIKFGVNYRF
jgi:outer membrane immunogenic protein